MGSTVLRLGLNCPAEPTQGQEMKPLSINSLMMPADFPADLFEKIFLASQRHANNPTYGQFIGAWNAVSYRYVSLAEYDECFTSSIQKHGVAPGSAQARYEQERDLFAFSSSAYSVFEAFHYGMFAIGAFIEPKVFVLATPADETKVGVAATHKKYGEAFPSDPILASFKGYLDDPARVDLSLLRNVLTHRAAPPRSYDLTVGPKDAKPSAEITRVNITLDENTTQSRRKDVSRLLTSCVNAAETFVASKL
jgi:hypothetical protein